MIQLVSIVAGLFMIVFGAWLAGAIYMVEDKITKRALAGYACCAVFVGVGLLILKST